MEQKRKLASSLSEEEKLTCKQRVNNPEYIAKILRLAEERGISPNVACRVILMMKRNAAKPENFAQPTKIKTKF